MSEAKIYHAERREVYHIAARRYRIRGLFGVKKIEKFTEIWYNELDISEFEKEDQECHHNMNVWKMV